ncbi:Calx-beta domain-containing protein [Thiocystis violacea]|uniref:Calx-beta domain-containing protein n=1 Tax=Thiocystis violacea TaxID=13725 RepID=UPI001905F682|nr:Calx-beta domain-containing protein [Thiocystis violacea]MBK1717504.1 hypothetical protein [Thiocystis violacea]
MSRLDGRCLVFALLTVGALPAVAQISFSNVTSTSGIEESGETFSSGWGDFDGDGFPDLFENKHQYTPTAVFFNQANPGAPGGRGFTDLAEQVLLNQPSLLVDTHGMTTADWDNDSDADVLEVTGAGYVFPVWVNDGSGNLTNQSGQLGFLYPTTWNRSGRPPTGGRSGLFFDYNNDGRLDALVTARDNYAAYRTPTAVFRQDLLSGNPNFVLDESTGVDLVNDVACESAMMAELSGDGVLDLICSDASRISRIWDTTTLPFGDLRSIVGDDIFNRYPADLAIGDFNGDLRTDIMAPTFWGADYGGNLVSTVDGRTLHGWFGTNVPYNSGFNFTASGNVTFEFDWWTAPANIFIGASGTNPALNTDLPIMPQQGVGHGDPHHVVVTLTQAQAAGLMTPNAADTKGVYIGYVNGQWQVRFSRINNWNIGMVVSAQTSLSQVTAVGGTKVGQGTTGNVLLYLQDQNHELVYTTGRVQAVNRSCNAAAAADLDNDMDLDVYFACTGELSNLPNVLYMNQGTGNFVPVPQAGGAEGQMPFGKAEAVMTADYDQDCRMDMYVTNGHHFRPFSYAGIHQLFRNTTANSNHCIQLDLVGTASNRDGIGAIIYAHTPDGRIQMREQSNGMHKKAQDFKRVHFGLGSNQLVDIEVHWPSGEEDYFSGLSVDQVVQLTEGTGDLSPSYSLAVNSVTVNEGPTGQQAEFTVTLSPAPGTGESVNVNYQTSNGSALAGSDYTTTSGTLTFLAGQITKTVTVPILNDSTPESTETFTLGVSSAVTSAATGTATIQDDDSNGSGPACGAPAYSTTTDRAAFLWNDCGTDVWHLRISGGSNPQYPRHLGSIESSQAFAAVSGFSIEANDVLNTSQANRIAFDLAVGGTFEDGINFTLASGASACFALTSPTTLPVFAGADRQPVNAQVGLPGFGVCAGGASHTVSVQNLSVNEGPEGQEGVFTVTLSPAPGMGEQVDVNYQTVNGSALAGSDYTATSGTLTFLAGDTEQTVAVPILNDEVAESTESFTLEVSGADTNTATGTGTILDDDGGSGPACGAPSYSTTTDRAAFLWNDCGTDVWHLRISGGSNPQYPRHLGSIESSQAFAAVSGFSIEANDVLNTSQANRIAFDLAVGGTFEDGINFTLASGASACFALTSPTTLPVFAGADRQPVDPEVGIPGFGVCTP